MSDPALAIKPVDEDELVVVASPAYRDILERLDRDSLTATPWVAREAGSGTRAAFETAVAAIGVDTARRHILELPSNEAIRTAVEAGAGLAVLSRLVAGPSIAAGTLIAAPIVLARRNFYRLRHKERYESKAARAFAQMIDEREAAAKGSSPRGA